MDFAKAIVFKINRKFKNLTFSPKELRSIRG